MLRRGRTAVSRAALALLDLVNRRRARNAPPPRADRIQILLMHAYGMGGTIRTVLNLAGYLAREREVEVVSLIRENEESFFPIPEGVTLTILDDRVTPPRGPGRLLSRMRSRLMPKEERAHHRFTLRSDLLLIRYLRSLHSGVLITTRPGFNLAAALFTPPGVVTIGQEHVNLESHDPALLRLIKRRYGRLDALVTLTNIDLRHYVKALKNDPPRHLTRIPNAIPPLAGEVSKLDEKVVMAVGRIVHAKGFDRLVRAWKPVAEAHPDWTLRIYGGATPEKEEKLRAQVEEAGLSEKIHLMGSTPEIGIELSKSSIYAVSSRYEGFGMTILEAMSKGVPVASFDCPHGPREIITHEHDGLLVRSTKAAALGKAISRLIEDEDLRHHLGENALRTADKYDLDVVGEQWDDLLARLTVRPV